MFNVLGFNFLFDSYALNPRPTTVEPLTLASVHNGIFDELSISGKVDPTTIDTTIPVSFDLYDVILCNFNGNINGGTIDVTNFDAIKIKRRVYGTFNWITLFEIPIESIADTYFTKYDKYAKNNTNYEYALVPVIGGIEGNYTLSSAESKFNKIYLCDKDHIYSLDARITFGNVSKSNKTSIFEPIMGKYPIVVSNAELKYRSGTLSGTVITPAEDRTKIWNISENVKLQNEIVDFLVNKKAKIYKDWMGNSYLILVVEDVNIVPDNNLNGRLADVTFSFVEIGDTENQEDLYENGLVDSQYV
jgi:hypothetical protein